MEWENKMRKILVVFSLLVLSACSNGQADFSGSSESSSEAVTSTATNENFYGDLHVDGTKIKDEKNDVVQLKGVSTHGINYYPEYVDKELFKAIKETTNINTIRIAMYTEDYNGYLTSDEETQKELLQTIDNAVKFAQELDMYVIIDWHILTDNNPLKHKNDAVEFFTTMSEKYGDIDNVIFEIANEPSEDATWEDITNYANAVVPAIRENSDNLIIVGTPNYSQGVDIASEAPLEYENIVYSLHFYAATHKEDLIAKAQTAIDNELPIFVSEFGISEASGDGSVDTASGDVWLEFLDKNEISYVMWNLSNKAESSALINSDVTDPSTITEDDLTESGKWYFEHVANGEKKTQPVVTKSEKSEEKSEKEEEKSELKATHDDDTWSTGGTFIFTVANEGTAKVADYTITIEFDQDVSVNQEWNGTTTVDGNKVTVKPLEYNKNLDGGASTDNIGFVVDSSTEPSIKTVTIK